MPASLHSLAPRLARAVGALVAVLLLGTLVPALAPTAAAAAPVRPTGMYAPEQGVLFGAYAAPRTATWDKASQQAIVNQREADMGQRLDIAHWYYKWGTTFPTWREEWHRDNGRIPLVSWAGPKTTDVNAGRYDTYIRERADAVAAYGSPLFLRWFWEMDGKMNADRAVSPTEYKAAWNRIRRIFSERGATNAAFVWCPNDWAFDNGGAGAWYPGDSQVDWVCADGYNWAPGRAGDDWRDFGQIFRNFHSFGLAHDKPMMVAEFGVQERSPGEKAAWYGQIAWALEHELPGISAVVAFDINYEFDWRVDSSASSYRAYTTLANAPWITGVAGPQPVTPPTSPTITGGTAADGSATVTWTPPADSATAPPTGYVVTAQPSGQRVMTAAIARDATITGLVNGTAYRLTVAATGVTGNSPASAPSAELVPAGAPGRPSLAGSAVRGDRSVSVSWTPPASDGGTPVTGYRITADPGGTSVTVDAATRTATVTGLRNGTEYGLRVTAVNRVGAGQPSALSNRVIAAAVPGAPAPGTATPGNGSATLTWSAPASTGGLPISGYRVTASPGGKTMWVAATQRRATVWGLVNGQVYELRVVAINGVGNSLPSAARAVTPRR